MTEKESYKLIISAFERERIKQDLKVFESQIQSETQRLKRRNAVAYTFAMAACIALFAVVHISIRNTLQIAGTYHFAQVEHWSFRGGCDAQALITTAYEQITTGYYDNALNNLLLALEILETQTFDISTPQGKHFAEMTALMINEVQWYRAITYMKNGNVWKARRLLREISRSESRYSEDAKSILRRR